MAKAKQEVNEVEMEGEVLPPSKQDIRAKIFSGPNMNRKSITVSFYGTEIEIRQPTVGEIEKLTADGGKTSLVTVLIDHAYVPGTSEKIFDYADTEQLTSMPFNEDMGKVAEAISQLTNMKVKAAEKN